MQTRSAIALGTLALMVGLIYFGEFLPNGRADLLAEHPHEGIACQTCHRMDQRPGDSTDSNARTQGCVECHASALESGSLFHKVGETRDCGNCHSFHKPELVIAAQDTMLMAFAEKAELLCKDCHTQSGTMPEVSPGHREAAALIHSQRTERFVESPSEYCLSCHDASRSRRSELVSTMSAPRFHIGASHVFGQILVAGSGKPGSVLRIQDELPQHLVLINGKTECQTCHSMKSKYDYQLSQRIEDGLCTSCHDMQRKLGPSPIFTSKS